MQSQVYEQIQQVVDKIREINGIIGVILFGSYSRGDFDEASDIDLLVIFENKKKLNGGLKEIYKITAESDQFFQAIGLTQEELKNSPILDSVLKNGKIYHAKEDIKKLLTPAHKPYALITYSTANLSPKERVLFAQKIQGRGKGKYKYDGLVQKLGGYNIGRGVVMIPIESLKDITKHFEQKKIHFVIRYIWA